MEMFVWTRLALSLVRVLNIGHVAVSRLNRAVTATLLQTVNGRPSPSLSTLPPPLLLLSRSRSPSPPPHCGSADGSCVTSPFLPPCFDPAVLIVQANPILPESLAQSQDCY